MTVRFEPDSLPDAVLRPLLMAAPDGDVYVEIMAPDFRFAFALALIVLLVLLALPRRRPAEPGQAAGAAPTPQRVLRVLACALAFAFVPWLATTGNGRYFLVALLLVGPVCVGLARLLPATRAARLAIVAGMVALQAFAVQQSAPWQAWTFAPWKQAPHFHVDVPAEWRTQAATIVTLSAISYSIIAPHFHPDSRWVSLHNAPAPASGAPVAHLTAAFLAKAQPGRVLLFVPVLPGQMQADLAPDDKVAGALDGQLAPYGLGLTQPRQCRFLHSATLAVMGLGEKTEAQRAQSGFWLCHLAVKPVPAPGGGSVSPRHDAVFRMLENQCPRFFPAGGDGAILAVPNGEMRSYLQSEMKAYVYDDGEVYYKYYRALNPVLVGKVPAVLDGSAKVDCGRIRGRAGLPWEREI